MTKEEIKERAREYADRCKKVAEIAFYEGIMDVVQNREIYDNRC